MSEDERQVIELLCSQLNPFWDPDTSARPKDCRIVFTPAEMLVAGIAGVMRKCQTGSDRDWQDHISDCLAQLAVAKYLGIKWVGKNPPSDTVGVARLSIAGDLVLYADDPADRIFWLVSRGNDRYSIQGWIRAKDGQLAEYRCGSSSYFVPVDALNTPESHPMCAAKTELS